MLEYLGSCSDHFERKKKEEERKKRDEEEITVKLILCVHLHLPNHKIVSICHSLMMTGNSVMDMLIMEWIENVELVCAMGKVEHYDCKVVLLPCISKEHMCSMHLTSSRLNHFGRMKLWMSFW